MKRALAILALWMLPAGAMAQTAGAPSDLESAQAEVDRDFTAAEAADCTMACQALDSMRRATEHLCTLDAGDRCAKARQKLADATSHVHASCPACAQQLDEESRKSPAQPPPEAPMANTVAEEAHVGKRGGCAGCATSGSTGGELVPLGVVVVALLAGRRRRGR